jgi:hypothetical protein
VIDRARVADLFDLIRADGVDPHQDLLWGYFFTDSDAEKLKAAARDLEMLGYRFVEIYPAGDDDSRLVLHVERVEQHEVDSLHELNQSFYKLAAAYGLASYDGMDVGPADGGPIPKPR